MDIEEEIRAEGPQVRMATAMEVGSCNACTRPAVGPVYQVTLRGQWVRVCNSCRIELIDLLKRRA